MDDELRKPIKWDRPCYKCGSHYCDLSCPDRAKNANANAAPEQEPVATDCTRIMREQGKPYPRTCPRCGFGPCVYSSTIVIAAPAPAPQREWQGLTKDEINDCAGAEIYSSTWAMAFAIGIEQTLRRKNHG